ncbi:MAG: hypothetical protein LBR71_03790 [Synergistaceae bacterium]|jgi:hypothetical protein|nr:hypothetical protein [Synergistaceae bacterium]
MKLTYEQLVKIVYKAIEVTQAAIVARAASFSFDEKNRDLIRRASASIGAEPGFVNAENLETLDARDILFVDYLPSGLLPKLALGIDEAPFSACFNRMILNGCKIFVLKSDPAESEKTPAAFRELLAGYRKILESYGYIFFGFSESGVAPKNVKNVNVKNLKDADSIFEGRIFCREDLRRYAPGGSVLLGQRVPVTPEALDCAKAMNITIRKAEVDLR